CRGSRHAAARSREGGSPLGFAVEDRLVLHAIVAREPAHQRTVHPIVEHPAHIFPRNACHGGEVALGHFLPDADAPLPKVTADPPSITESSPTTAPGPSIARMRSPPAAAATLALSKPSSIR